MISAGALLGAIINGTDSPETYWQLLTLMAEGPSAVAEALNLRDLSSARRILDACECQEALGGALLSAWFAHIDALEGNNLRRHLCEKIESRAAVQIKSLEQRRETMVLRLQQSIDVQIKLAQAEHQSAQLESEYAAARELEAHIQELQSAQQTMQAEIKRIHSVDIVALERSIADLHAQSSVTAQQIEMLEAQRSRLAEEIKQQEQHRKALESEVEQQLKGDLAALQKWISKRQKYLETARDRSGRLGDLDLPPELSHLLPEIEELQRLLSDGEGGIHTRINHVYGEWKIAMEEQRRASGSV